jgi:hypothetical protein
MSLGLAIGIATAVYYIKVKCFNKVCAPFITKVAKREVNYDNTRKTVSLQVDFPEEKNAKESYETAPLYPSLPKENTQV